MRSLAKATGLPRSSASRSATGRSDGPPSARSAKSSPFGRPRWAMTMTRAPRSASFLITGSEARMRPSSVISPLPDLSRGTLRSDRTSTRRPLTSMSSMLSMLLRSLKAGRDERGQVDEAVGVAPLVVVPAEDLHLVAVGHGDRRVERAGRGRADDVGRDDLVLGVDEDVLERALGGGLERGVDLVLGDFPAELHDQVGDGAGDHRDAQR